MNEVRKQITLLLLLSGLAFLAVKSHQVAFFIGLSALVIGLFSTVLTRNRNGAAHLFTAFIVGSEIFYRMTDAGLPSEFGKYASILLLGTGWLVQKKKRTFPPYILSYFLLLIPGAIITFDAVGFTAARKLVAFNLSGPMLIVVAFIYFYKRPFGDDDLKNLSRFFVYGVVLMAAYVYMHVGDYARISYNLGSNASSSGGFAATQVAPMFAAGILVLLVNLFQKRVLFGSVIVDVALMSAFMVQILFTFSRGGLFSAILALGLALIISRSLSFKRLLVTFVLPSVIFLFAFQFVDQTTGGNIYKRYLNQDEYGNKIKADYTTGRENILKTDLEIFGDNILLGVGAGMATEIRRQRLGIQLSSHDEYSRAVAEHGLLGLFALIILILLPLKYYFELSSNKKKFLFLAFMLFGASMMAHGAMRMALMSFFYGLAFVAFRFDKSTAPRVT